MDAKLMARALRLNSGMHEVASGIRRVTFPLPLGIDHVHCYFLAAADGSWTVVDTGLGLPGAEERWAPILAELDGPLERIVVTHFHPDHVGDSAPLAELSGAAVFQSRVDHVQCTRVWGDGRSPQRLARHMLAHGMPEAEVEEARRDSDGLVRLVNPAADPQPLEPGDEIAGWEVVHLPGHADGHLGLLRRGELIAGDALLAEISPNVGLYPEARPDPLGDYLRSLERIVEFAPTVAFAGHGPPIADPVGRARELQDHHRERLDVALSALGDGPRTAYEVSLVVFGAELSPSLRRFALAESLAHLERLVREQRAERIDEGARVLYAATG
jgi:glyoxylase-like metal-dependent hydrolase (beta-lactamase superfamily II)